MWLFEDHTIGDIRKVVDRTIQSKKRLRTTSAGPSKRTSARHVKWDLMPLYTCIRDGIPVESEHAVDALFKEKRLTQEHFYIFKHNDSNVERNQEVPLYEAVYKCGTAFIKAQKCHLKQAYINSGKMESSMIWSIGVDGVPYHVDRFCYARQSQLDSKKRYEKKNKNPSVFVK